MHNQVLVKIDILIVLTTVVIIKITVVSVIAASTCIDSRQAMTLTTVAFSIFVITSIVIRIVMVITSSRNASITFAVVILNMVLSMSMRHNNDDCDVGCDCS